MKALRLVTLACFLLSLGLAKAQDLHFSQYYASPLTLNPALTGKHDGLYRFNAIYRDQWRNLYNAPNFNNGGGEGAMFMTPAVSVDFSLLKDKLKNDALGVGAQFVYDKDGELFRTYQASIALAYHKGLDKEGRYNLSLGLQGVYRNNTVGLDPLTTFSDNINAPGTTSADIANINFDTRHLFDFNAGLMFDGRVTDWMTVYAGVNWLHIPNPSNDFVSDTTAVEAETPWNWVTHGGIEMLINDRIYVIPGVLYQRTQTENQEINFGSTFGYQFRNENFDPTAAVYLGAWYRWDDAIIAKAGFDYKNFRVSGAYDIGILQMKDDFNNAVGRIPTSWEIAVSYFGFGGKPLTDDDYMFNPRF